MPKENIFNLANAFTFLRVVLILPVMLLLHSGRTLEAIILFIFMVGTDGVDGWLARKLNQVTDFGEYFDFVVDFIYYYAFIIYFIVVGKVHVVSSVMIAAATIALVWIAVQLSRKSGYFYMPHRWSAKIMAILLIGSIAGFMIDWYYANLFFFLTLIYTFIYTLPDYIIYTSGYKGKGKQKAKHKKA